MDGISLFSFVMAVFWFDIFVLLTALLRKRTRFVLRFGLLPLLTLVVLAVLRMLICFDFRFSAVIPSEEVYPLVYDLIRYKIFSIKGMERWVLDALLAIWAIGALFMLFRIFTQVKQSYGAVKTLEHRHDPRISAIFGQIFDDISARLVISKQIGMPAVMGFSKPIILLPDCISDFPNEDVENILRHELAHFRHGDHWLKLMVNILCALFWWNPVIYLLRSDWDRILEINCDNTVTAPMDERGRVAYSESVVKILRQVSSRRGLRPAISSGFAFCSSDKAIRQRLQLLLTHRQSRKHSAKWLASALLLLLFMSSYSFTLKPYYPVPAAAIAGYIDPAVTDEIQADDGTWWLITEWGAVVEMTDSAPGYDIPASERSCWVYREFNGLLQKRLWSETGGQWLCGWINC